MWRCVGEVVAVMVVLAVMVVMVVLVWAGVLAMVIGEGCRGDRKRC